MEQIIAIKALAAKSFTYLTAHWHLALVALVLLWVVASSIRMFFYRLARGEGFFKALLWALVACLILPPGAAWRLKQHDQDMQRRREGPPGNLTDRF